ESRGLGRYRVVECEGIGRASYAECNARPFNRRIRSHKEQEHCIATVVLLGTLDTKGIEYGYLRDQILEHSSCDVLMVDASVLGEPRSPPDITRDEVAEAAGTTVAQLAQANDRGAAVATMADVAARVLTRLFQEGRVQGVLGLGGSGGSSLVTHAM